MKTRLFSVLLGIIALTSQACSPTGTNAGANVEGLKQIRSVRLPTVGGQETSISQYRNKIVMLHFFSSWCRECAAEVPTLNNLSSNFSGTDFVILGVAVDDDPFDAQTFALQNNIHFPVLIDTNDDMKDFFQIREIPATLFLDRNGLPIRFRDPQTGNTTAKLAGPRVWDTVGPVEMVAQLIESK